MGLQQFLALTWRAREPVQLQEQTPVLLVAAAAEWQVAGPGLHWKWSAWACSWVLGAVWVSVRRGGELVLSAFAAEALAGPVAAAAELVDEAFHWPVPLQLVGEVLEFAL